MKQPGRDVVIAGKFCLERELAAGGMGSVWVGRHLDLDIDVAVKFMDPSCATPEGRIRFEREAKAAACLQSPHVVAVLDYGLDDDLPYIVMELLKGEDLEDRLDRQGRLSLEEASRILSQASKALRRAQELGIVHRDLKPHNLFLCKGGVDGDENEETLKILDFGIAKETGPAIVGGATQTGELMGSPHYMSPEHVRGAKDIDFRSDLWSLGVIIFRSVTGRLPFDSENVGDVIGKILADPIPKPTHIAPDLPEAIDDYFAKALSRDRNQRFQSAKEMAEVFAELVRSPELARVSLDRLSPHPPKPVAAVHGAPPLPPLADAASESSAAQATTIAMPAKPAKEGSSAVLKGIAAGLFIVIAAGVAVLVLAFSGGQPPAPQSANESSTAAAAPNPPATATVGGAPPTSPAQPPSAVTTAPPPEASTSPVVANTTVTAPAVKTGAKPPTTAQGATTTAAPQGSTPIKKKNWGF